jgi:Mrp family chromosome partitioning ATPase
MAEMTRRPPSYEDPSVYVLSEEEDEVAAAPPPAPERSGPPRRPHPLLSLRRHKFLAALGFLLAAAAWAPFLYLLQTRSVYRAESLLLVSPVFAKNLNEDREFQLPRFEEFVNQQLILISREDVALDALDRLGDRKGALQPGGSRREAALRLAASLEAKRVPTTSYITVSLDGPTPDGLAETVNAAVDAFLTRAKGQPFYGLDTRLEALNRQKARLQDEIRAKTDILTRWAKEYGVSGFEANPHAAALAEADRSLQEARRKRLEAEARLAGAKARQDFAHQLDVTLEAREALGTDVEMNGLRTVLLTRKSELKSKVMGLTAEHPGRQSSEKLIAEIDEEIARTEAATLERLQTLLSQRRDAKLKEDLQGAWLDLDQSRRFEDTMATEITALSQKAARFNDVYFDAVNIQQDLERVRKQFTAIEDRLDLMRLETHAPGFVHLVGPASAPTTPVPPKTLRWGILAILSALALALIVPLSFDLLDRRVYGPADLEGLVPSASLLWMPERRTATDAFARDQVRRLAIALDRELRLNHLSMFVVTPVRVPGGTFRLTLEVARELEAMGRRALVVEANILEPDPAFASSNGRAGLVSALSGASRVEDVVEPAVKGLPDRIPAGDPAGRALLPNASALRALLERLSHRYQIVLIDAPPLLSSSDAELLAGIADGSVLVTQARKARMADLTLAVDQLQRTGRPLIATVIQRVTTVSRAGGVLTPV